VNVTGRKISVSGVAKEAISTDRNVYVKAYPQITLSNGTTINTEYTITGTVSANTTTLSGSVTIETVDVNRTDVSRLLQEYAVFCGSE
jgi:hypothetical protein